MDQGSSKHIEKKYHFLKDQVNNIKLRVKYYKTELQLANIFTKLLKIDRFECLKEIIGMRKLTDKN